MLQSLIVQNLRSFISEVEIELRPITVLLGRNSSGKSTITRLMPLYQQSFEQRTSAPILWNGGLVDFGSINDVRNRINKDKPITMGFTITPNGERYFSREHWHFAPNRVFHDGKPISYKVTLTEHGDATYRRTRISRIEISINDDAIMFELKENGSVENCTINNESYLDAVAPSELIFDVHNFFPSVRSKKTSITVNVNNAYMPFDQLAEQRVRLITGLTHGGTSTAKKREIALLIPYTSNAEFSDAITKHHVGTPIFQSNVASRQLWNSDTTKRLRGLVMLSALQQIINVIGNSASAEFASSSYIGPTRAAGERYYRWQELAVDRLDPKGENFAMYVMSLPQAQQARFSELLEQNFGYALMAKRESGHASLMLSETGSNEWYNIADVGFGFSQILPVIAQIHAAGLRRANRQRIRWAPDAATSASPVIAVEQPELHLHPAFQARIADLLVSSSNARLKDDGQPGDVPGGRSRRFIVETHSEAFVNRLSELVARGNIAASDAIIYIFDKPDGGESVVKRSEFTPDGKISNWPYGFFHY